MHPSQKTSTFSTKKLLICKNFCCLPACSSNIHHGLILGLLVCCVAEIFTSQLGFVVISVAMNAWIYEVGRYVGGPCVLFSFQLNQGGPFCQGYGELC